MNIVPGAAEQHLEESCQLQPRGTCGGCGSPAGLPSAFLVEGTQVPCSKGKGLLYSLSRENSYFLHCKNSQEVPLRINIAFHPSKEELITGGHRLEAKPHFLGSLALHICLLRAISISLEGGVAGLAQEQTEPETGLALHLSRTLCPAKRQA